MEVKVGISNRHVHLTEDVYALLFDLPLTKRNDLLQGEEFAANEVVTIKSNDRKIENVRIIGPLRKYNQVEISKSDSYLLGLNPPIRKSGDLENSEDITICTSKGEVYLKSSCIIANRHLHINSEDAKKYNIVDNQKIQMEITTEKSGTIDVYAKVIEGATLELHLDRDDGNAFLLNSGDTVTWKI